MLIAKMRSHKLFILGVVAALVILVAATSPQYVLALAAAGALWIGIWRYLGAIPHRRLVLLGCGVVLLWGAGMAAHPPGVSTPLPAVSKSPGLPIPDTVLADPTDIAGWLAWAQQAPTNARMASGVVALEVSMLVHPAQPVFPADLAVAYEEMARGVPSWTDSLIARYYGIQAGLIPPLPISPAP